VASHDRGNPRMLHPVADLFGIALQEYFAGARLAAHLRRSDGKLVRLDLARYFAGFAFFASFEQELLSAAAGRVMDLGAGAGRASLYLQEVACGGPTTAPSDVTAVVAVDASPGACACLGQRGVGDVNCLSWADLPTARLAAESFDTIVLLGAGLGMAGTPLHLPRLLGKLSRLLRRGGKALVTGSASAARLRTIRLRLEYGNRIGAWFDWLEVPPADLVAAAQACGMAAASGPLGRQDDEYAFILSKDEPAGWRR